MLTRFDPKKPECPAGHAKSCLTGEPLQTTRRNVNNTRGGGCHVRDCGQRMVTFLHRFFPHRTLFWWQVLVTSVPQKCYEMNVFAANIGVYDIICGCLDTHSTALTCRVRLHVPLGKKRFPPKAPVSWLRGMSPSSFRWEQLWAVRQQALPQHTLRYLNTHLYDSGIKCKNIVYSHCKG